MEGNRVDEVPRAPRFKYFPWLRPNKSAPVLLSQRQEVFFINGTRWWPVISTLWIATLFLSPSGIKWK